MELLVQCIVCILTSIWKFVGRVMVDGLYGDQFQGKNPYCIIDFK
jgi:hypothetical protein